MHNIKLVIAYEGTHYLGWQKTPTGPTVESILQQTLEQILQQPIILQAASRTDAGVHALGQVVNFFVYKQINLSRLKTSLNGLLPKDIIILSADEVDTHFHPTLDCKSKEYRYYICFGSVQFPQHRQFSWHYPHPLNLDEMKEAAPSLLGKHDFSSFCNTKRNTNHKDFIREVTSIEISPIDYERISIHIQGNNFLYKMVRNLVGTLLNVGSGKLTKNQIPLILNSKDRTFAGVTAPAHGLFLHHINY